ncbi:MAG TPA: helix-turn-helix transcriptional regulator [Gemmatimonadaceae bacterium]
MRIALRADETARLSSALLCLLSPAVQPGADAWLATAARGVRALIGGDKAVIAVERRGGSRLHSDGIPRDVVDAYTIHYARLDLGMLRLRERGLALWSRRMLWEKEVLARSEYYNDFARPFGLHDTVGLAVTLPASAVRVCLAVFHHEPVRHSAVTSRQLRLLALALPAFRTGVAMWAHGRWDANLHVAGPPCLGTAPPPDAAPAPTLHQLRSRYSLTDREVQVAELLVKRRTNAEIASALGVSLHTARHHTESVLLKVGVHSRVAIEQVIGQA